MKKSYPEWLRVVVGNEQIQKRKSANQPRVISRVKIGANVVSGDFVATKLLPDLLDSEHPLGRNTSPVEPHRDDGLTNRLTSDVAEPSSERNLTTGLGDHHLKELDTGRLCAHLRPKDNTVSVLSVNTQSVNVSNQTKRMPKEIPPSEFWKRLTLARESCRPPKDMTQTTVGEDYGASQAAVTKWRTGGPRRDEGIFSLPEPEKILKMALDTGVCTDWLWSGRGDMRPLPATDHMIFTIVDLINQIPAGAARQKVLTATVEAVALQKASLENPEIARALARAEQSTRELLRQSHVKR